MLQQYSPLLCLKFCDIIIVIVLYILLSSLLFSTSFFSEAHLCDASVDPNVVTEFQSWIIIEQILGGRECIISSGRSKLFLSFLSHFQPGIKNAWVCREKAFWVFNTSFCGNMFSNQPVFNFHRGVLCKKGGLFYLK